MGACQTLPSDTYLGNIFNSLKLAVRLSTMSYGVFPSLVCLPMEGGSTGCPKNYVISCIFYMFSPENVGTQIVHAIT